jgi:hypothetical protein
VRWTRGPGSIRETPVGRGIPSFLLLEGLSLGGLETLGSVCEESGNWTFNTSFFLVK